MFNSAAQRLFGFANPSEKGMKLQELPLNNTARQAILRRHRSVIQTRKQSNIRDCHLVTNRFDGVADVHFTPLSTETGHGVIVMFQVERNDKRQPARKTVKKTRSAGKTAKKKRR
jgi:nitrogen-specific signal transduction histidine kinase